MGKENKKPGVMFYFGDFHIIKSLSDEELGILFRAAVEYAEYGTVPDIPKSLTVSWEFLRAAADKDSKNYEKKCLQSEYANYCKHQKLNNLEKLSFDDWLAVKHDGSERVPKGSERVPKGSERVPKGSERNPIPITNSNSNTNSSSKYIYNSLSPTREEVRAYVAQMGYKFDPDKFFNTYNTVGWKKHGDLIVDWKSLADNWEKTETRPESRNKKNSDMQQHGEVSPLMREAVRQMLEEEGEQYDDTV